MISLLPALGVALYLLKGLFDARTLPPNAWGIFQILMQFVVPLAISAIVAWIFSRRKKTRSGVLLGILVLLAAYSALYFRSEYEIAECARHNSEGISAVNFCGELSFVLYLMWSGLFIVNATALLGLGYWLDRWRSQHPSSVTTEGNTLSA